MKPFPEYEAPSYLKLSKLLTVTIIIILISTGPLNAGASTYIEADRAYAFRIEPYALGGMSLRGVGFWNDQVTIPANPVSLHYMQDYTIFPVLNSGCDISRDERNFYNTLKEYSNPDNTLTMPDSVLRQLQAGTNTIHASWVPVLCKKGDWIIAVFSSLTKNIHLEEIDTVTTPHMVAAKISYTSDLGLRIGQAEELINRKWLRLSIGYNLNLIFSAISQNVTYSTLKNFAVHLNPVPRDFKDMRTRLGYSFDFGIGGLITPLHVRYALLSESVLGQLRYVRTKPWYHMGLGWLACLPTEEKVPDLNFSLGMELYRMGDLNFRESVSLGAEIKLFGLFIRGGYRNSGASTGGGIKLGNLHFHYAYYPGPVDAAGEAVYRQGLEFYTRF